MIPRYSTATVLKICHVNGYEVLDSFRASVSSATPVEPDSVASFESKDVTPFTQVSFHARGLPTVSDVKIRSSGLFQFLIFTLAGLSSKKNLCSLQSPTFSSSADAG